jgi:hypothetical protein
MMKRAPDNVRYLGQFGEQYSLGVLPPVTPSGRARANPCRQNARRSRCLGKDVVDILYRERSEDRCTWRRRVVRAIAQLSEIAQAHALAPGLTARSVLEKFAAVQMIDGHLPTADGRELLPTRIPRPSPSSGCC